MKIVSKIIIAAEVLAVLALVGFIALRLADKPNGRVITPTFNYVAANVSVNAAAERVDYQNDNDIFADPVNIERDAVEPPPSRIVTMAFTGDILLDSGVKSKIISGGFGAVIDEAAMEPLIDADITYVDLELPFSTRGAMWSGKEFNFRGDPKHLQLLSNMGVDIVTLANNHTIDYGYDALLDTIGYLTDLGIGYAGAGVDKEDASAFRLYEANGVTVALLAASRVIPDMGWYATKDRPGVFATYDGAELCAKIREAKEAADIVVVFAHWGVERNDRPEAYQTNLAHMYIENGADAVVACHTHCLQGFEFYMGKPIAYSLGNFIFTDANKDTAILTITFDENAEGSPLMSLTPCLITDKKTSLMTDESRLEALRRHINDISFGVFADEAFNIIAK